MTSSSNQQTNTSTVQRRMSQVLCPTCNEPQREQTYQLEPLDGPPTNNFHTEHAECSDSCSNDQPEGEETSASQSSNSASQQQQHEETVRELEQQIIGLKMDLAEEKDRNGHLVQSKIDLEKELSKSQKSHGALLVESTKHKFDAQNAVRENESLRAENELLRAEMEEMKKQRLHAGMVATVDQEPDSTLVASSTGTSPDHNASDGSLGDMLKDLFTSDKRRRSTASTAACTTATSATSSSSTEAACPRPSFQRANSGGFFRDLAADIERR